jgi:hypothetical protein
MRIVRIYEICMGIDCLGSTKENIITFELYIKGVDCGDLVYETVPFRRC